MKINFKSCHVLIWTSQSATQFKNIHWSKNRYENNKLLVLLLRLRYFTEVALKWLSSKQKPTKQIYDDLAVIWVCIISNKISSWEQINYYKFHKYSTCLKKHSFITLKIKLIADINHCYKWRTPVTSYLVKLKSFILSLEIKFLKLFYSILSTVDFH